MQNETVRYVALREICKTLLVGRGYERVIDNVLAHERASGLIDLRVRRLLAEAERISKAALQAGPAQLNATVNVATTRTTTAKTPTYQRIRENYGSGHDIVPAIKRVRRAKDVPSDVREALDRLEATLARGFDNGTRGPSSPMVQAEDLAYEALEKHGFMAPLAD